MLKENINQLNPIKQCKQYGLSPWQCPQFLFLIMGCFIAATIIFTYIVSNRYIEDPSIVTVIVFLLSIILIIIAFIITKSFEKLVEVARIKAEFILVVSHQLRTPLTNLNWAMDFLMSGGAGKVEEKQAEYLRILKENSVRMTGLIKDLITVSKIETGNFLLPKEEVSLPELIKELIGEFKLFSGALNLEIEFQTQENLLKVKCNPEQIKLVVKNLLDNAVRYTKGSGVIRINLEKKREKLYFEIKDSGVGIPKEDQKYIFQKFFRSSNIMRYQTQGIGLGLYITKSIIEKLGGKIWFKSKEGEGTTFYFTLPV